MRFLQKYKDNIDNFNRIFNTGKNIGIISTAVASGILWFVSLKPINNFLINDLHISSDTLSKFINTKNVILIILGVLLLFSLLKFIYNAILSSANNQRKITSFTKMIHLIFIHNTRSKIVELDELSDRLKLAVENEDNIDDIYNEELEKLKKNIQPCVDELGDFLSRYRDEKVSVCVKTFVNGSRYKKDYMEESLMTIARSKNTRKSRTSSHLSIVGKNSDFIDLCYGKSMFFGKCGLKDKYDNGLYKNDSPEWWKKYNSTLVAPIRYFNKDGIKGNINIDIDVIGFLCIDCKKDIKEWEFRDSFELQLLAIIADSLYTYIRLFFNCFDNINYFTEGDK